MIDTRRRGQGLQADVGRLVGAEGWPVPKTGPIVQQCGRRALRRASEVAGAGGHIRERAQGGVGRIGVGGKGWVEGFDER